MLELLLSFIRNLNHAHGCVKRQELYPCGSFGILPACTCCFDTDHVMIVSWRRPVPSHTVPPRLGQVLQGHSGVLQSLPVWVLASSTSCICCIFCTSTVRCCSFITTGIWVLCPRQHDDLRNESYFDDQCLFFTEGSTIAERVVSPDQT